jgi:hypothetical protein
MVFWRRSMWRLVTTAAYRIPRNTYFVSSTCSNIEGYLSHKSTRLLLHAFRPCRNTFSNSTHANVPRSSMPPFPRNMTVSLERTNKAAPARLVPGSIKSITWIRLAPILLKGGNLRRSEKNQERNNSVRRDQQFTDPGRRRKRRVVKFGP